MVVHIAAATRAATAASQAGATALGLGLGKTDLELAQLFFRQQMQQTKRLWTADYAEASIRHGETCTQSARQHAESQAAANAAYFQAERLAGQSIRLSRDQDSRAYEMAWRAEVRESLRDELGNQNNWFNIIMLCNTVCLGCVFSLAADGAPPIETSSMMLNSYIFCLGVSIMLFTVSLWCSVIVVRRLHDNTAARLEQKLFIQNEDLQRVWQDQLKKDKPTGPTEIYLVNKAYEKWVSEIIDPIGMFALNMLSLGVVMMFVTAGLLMHNRYMTGYENATISIPIIFWSIVVITSGTVLYMKFAEDRSEKRKQGAYSVSWQDDATQSMIGPFAKVRMAGEALSSKAAAELGSTDRMQSLADREQNERSFCATAKSLHTQLNALSGESVDRAVLRKEILAILTSATEEFETLSEEFITRLNKVVYSIDEADERNSHLVGINKEHMFHQPLGGSGPNAMPPKVTEPMPIHPVNSQRVPIALESLRSKLGEFPITTLLRIKNII